MNSFNTANLHWPPSTLNPPQPPPPELNSDRLLPFFRATKRGDNKTCHKDNILGPQVDMICIFHYMTAIMLLWVKFQETLCTKGEKTPTQLSCFSPQSQSHMSCGADTSSSSELLMLEAEEWSGTLSLLPSHRRGQSHCSTQSLIFPTLTYSPQHLCSGSFWRCFKKGESWKQSMPSALLFLLPGKEAMEEATQALGCFCIYRTQN